MNNYSQCNDIFNLVRYKIHVKNCTRETIHTAIYCNFQRINYFSLENAA